MQPVTNRHHRKCSGHVETGMALIVLGVIFLLVKLDMVHIEWQWYMIPTAIFAVLGLAELVQFRRPHKMFEGFSKIVLAGWFYAAFSGLWGLSPANSWPIILILVGSGLVVKSLFKSKAGSHDHSNGE